MAGVALLSSGFAPASGPTEPRRSGLGGGVGVFPKCQSLALRVARLQPLLFELLLFGDLFVSIGKLLFYVI